VTPDPVSGGETELAKLALKIQGIGISLGFQGAYGDNGDNIDIPICVAIMEKIIGTNLQGFIKNGIAKKHRNRDKNWYSGIITQGFFMGTSPLVIFPARFFQDLRRG